MNRVNLYAVYPRGWSLFIYHLYRICWSIVHPYSPTWAIPSNVLFQCSSRLSSTRRVLCTDNFNQQKHIFCCQDWSPRTPLKVLSSSSWSRCKIGCRRLWHWNRWRTTAISENLKEKHWPLLEELLPESQSSEQTTSGESRNPSPWQNNSNKCSQDDDLDVEDWTRETKQFPVDCGTTMKRDRRKF